MKIIKPSVKLIEFSDRIQQIGYAASICYGSSKQGTVEWLEQLWKSGHKSVFRHGTRYYVIPSNIVNDYVKYSLKFSPYCGFYEDEYSQKIFVSINEQYYVEHPYLRNYSAFECNELNFICEGKEIGKYEEVKKLIRVTFEYVTQISTSRELNRVSPNNICEQSTRYCNFSKDKFGKEIAICQPHWFDVLQGKQETSITFENVSTLNVEIIKEEYLLSGFMARYLLSCLEAERQYIAATENKVLAQDARGILPLDTATKCIYTYRIEEWNHIIDLRYIGTTGNPHPNAIIVTGLMKELLENKLK
jgi:thymidylate synthase (FAD)